MIDVFNKVGYVGRIEEKKSQKDEAYVVFSLAVRTGYGDKEKTKWYKCIVFDPKLVERLKRAKVRKGSFVQVVGEQDEEEFKKKDGTVGTCDTVFLFAFSYVYSGKRQENGDAAAAAPAGNAPQSGAASTAGSGGDFEDVDLDDDGDLPF